MSPRDPARRTDPLVAAMEILERFSMGRGLLDRLADDAFDRHPGLSKNERSLVTAMAFGTVRHLGRVDFVLSRFSSTPLAKVKPRILSILRLGAFQLLYTDRPAPLVVDGCVRLVGGKAPKWLTGFVNGLLRTVARQGQDAVLPDFGRDPAGHLAAALSCPEWLAQRRVERLGPEEARQLCEADNRIPFLFIRENPLAPGFTDLEPLLADHVRDLAPGRYAPGSWSFTRPDAALDALDAHCRGFFTVQDEGSQLVSLLLAPQPGERVLDACAGMGVKTGHLVQLMKNQGEVVAADVEAGKLRVLEKEMERIHAGIAATRLKEPGGEYLLPGEEPFPRVLVDAPCSGLGALRRHPDAKWLKTGADLPRQAENQLSILSLAAKAVAPGGTLVYAVCSLEPEENEGVADRFLGGHTDFTLSAPAARLPEPARDMESPDGFFRARPHVHGTDGFFVAVFTRRP